MNDLKQQIKGYLNNLLLLRFVKKNSADGLCENNDFAKKFNIQTNENSLSILDTTKSKLLVTDSEFTGEEYTKYSVKQLAELLDTIGKVDGEVIIPKDSSMGEMLVKTNRDILVICSLPKQDIKKK